MIDRTNIVPIVFSSLCNHLTEEEKAGCFISIIFFLSCECLCTVSLPLGAMGLTVVCDCCISWSESFVILI